jgi:hypothetical protein
MQHWKSLPTITAMDQYSTVHGVRWTPLCILPYFDPVHHPVLGFMHNWLLSKCQDHLREFWGLETIIFKKTLNDDDDDEVDFTEEEADSELEQLMMESTESAAESMAADEEGSTFSSQTFCSMHSQSRSLSSSAEREVFDLVAIPEDGDEDIGDPDYFIPGDTHFTPTQIAAI